MDLLNNAFIGTHMERSSRDPHGILAAYEFGLSKAIFEKLWEKYPGYDWKVKVDAANGYARVQLPRLHRSTLGYTIILDELASDVNFAVAMRGAGEMLERWKLRRGKANKAEYVDALRKAGRIFGLHDEVPGGSIKGATAPQRPRLIVPREFANDNRLMAQAAA